MIWPWIVRFGKSCHSIISGADNKTLSVFRIAAMTISAHMCGLQFVDTVIHAHPFASQDFGIGMAAIWAAVGLGERAAQYPFAGGGGSVGGGHDWG